MKYLSYINPVHTENTMEILDEVSKTIGGKVRKVAKLFGIVLCWFLANVIFAVFISRTHGISLDALRLVRDGLREVMTLDCSVYVAFFFDSKVNCIITLAVLLVCGGGYAHLLAIIKCDKTSQDKVHNHTKYTQRSVKCDAYVISYKQQVAFLA